MTASLSASLQAHFGFSSFRPGQAEAVKRLLEGQHTLVVMPTGAGKSLIYQLAALLLQGVTLVISPLISLMKDQVDSLARHRIPATYINSALPANEQNYRLRSLAQRRYRLVYVAPERLRSAPFLEALRHNKISLLAVDEAHCISEWGHDFRPDYLHIASARAALEQPLTVALTATATPQVQGDIERLLGLRAARRIVTGFNRPNLTLEVSYSASLPAKLRALQELFTGQDGRAAIIYAGTRCDAEEVAEFMRQVIGLPAEHYHAGLEASERARIQDAFIQGRLPIVAATNAFGMGIDRPDVRQVIHYSLPGALEAYYQEAGRAGRDGLPARAVLLYAPQDRALQEWFIKNSFTGPDELRALYQALRPAAGRNETWMTTEDFSRLTGLPEVRVRLGLAQLERAGAVERLGDEGVRMLLSRREWDQAEIQAAVARAQEHQRHRKIQLDRMIAYAETNTCRRRVLLEHFGDAGPVEADDCCDNCRAKEGTSEAAGDIARLDQSQRAALIVLDCLRRLKRGVGREKLAQILKGSRARDIRKFGYDRSLYYGKLEVFLQREIEALIEQLIGLGYLKVIGGEYPVLSLTSQGEAALHSRIAIPIHLSRQISSGAAERKRAEREAGGTLEFTAQLASAGLSPAQIAEQRGLAQTTIYSHLARLIADGRIPVNTVVPAELRQQVEAAIERAGGSDLLSPIKALLPEEVDYGIIRCVVEGLKREKPMTSAHSSQEGTDDRVENFLSQSHPRPLAGPWSVGWALDFHSRFAGEEWNRTVSGELAFRLKYREDLSALPPLVDSALALITVHPELAQVDAIAAVPPSAQRRVDPVLAFAEALGARLGLSVEPILVKTRQTAPQKEMSSLAQKRSNVAGAFAVKAPVRGIQLLVIDDLLDSGATLAEITCLLLRSGAKRVCVLTLTRTIHSNA